MRAYCKFFFIFGALTGVYLLSDFLPTVPVHSSSRLFRCAVRVLWLRTPVLAVADAEQCALSCRVESRFGSIYLFVGSKAGALSRRFGMSQPLWWSACLFLRDVFSRGCLSLLPVNPFIWLVCAGCFSPRVFSLNNGAGQYLLEFYFWPPLCGTLFFFFSLSLGNPFSGSLVGVCWLLAEWWRAFAVVPTTVRLTVLWFLSLLVRKIPFGSALFFWTARACLQAGSWQSPVPP